MSSGALRTLLFVLAAVACDAAGARELVHPFPPQGPVEVAGASRAGRVLRAMQRYAAPSFSDLLAMHVAGALPPDVPVTVTRRHRGNGDAALAYVGAAAPDGRTLLLAAVPARAAPLPRLTPVAIVSAMPYAWVVRHDLADADFGRVLRGLLGRALVGHPGERTIAYAAIARMRAGGFAAIEPLAYNGGIGALNALAADQVRGALVPLPAVLPYVGAGRLRLACIADAVRHASTPDVPRCAEIGIGEDEAVTRFAVYAPAGTPAAIRRPVLEALAHVAQPEASRALFAGFGVRLEYRPIEEKLEPKR